MTIARLLPVLALGVSASVGAGIATASTTSAASNRPAVTGVSPNRGSTIGSSQVVVAGRHFTASSTVTFGGVPARSVRVISSRVLEVYTPALRSGARQVAVRTEAGLSATSAASRYTFTHVTLPGSWQDSRGPSASGPKLQQADATSCPKVGTCYSVGSAAKLGGEKERATVLIRTGSTQQAGIAPLPVGASGRAVSQLDEITCPAVGSCTAIGYYDDFRKAMLLHLAGGTWTAMQAMLPDELDTDRIVELNSLSCGGPEDCVAVGDIRNDNGVSDAPGLIYTLHTGAWTVQRAPTPVAAPMASVNGVSCPTATWCLAEGSYSVPGSVNQYLLTYSAGTWSAQDEPTTPVGHDLPIHALQCPAVRRCTMRVAVPEEFLTLRGSAFAYHAIPLPADAKGSDLRSDDGPLTCPTVSVCYSLDSFLEGGASSDARTDAVVIRLDGDRVRVFVMPETLAASGGHDYLRRTTLADISCSSSTSCVAVGTVGLRTHELTAVYDTLAGGVWSPGVYAVPKGSPKNPDLELGGVSCPSTGACFAVGSLVGFDRVQDESNYARTVTAVQTPAGRAAG